MKRLKSIYWYWRKRWQRWRAHSLVRSSPRIKISLGSGVTGQHGWINTDVEFLDVTRGHDWQLFLDGRKADALVAEHVWEHLTDAQTQLANANCFAFLAPGGRMRLAVSDGLHPDPGYIEHARPGGSGLGADDHKVLYDYRLMQTRLAAAGFEFHLLEYWDEAGTFHFADWSAADGDIARSSRNDERNRVRALSYTSLIVDAIKPGTSVE